MVEGGLAGIINVSRGLDLVSVDSRNSQAGCKNKRDLRIKP